MNNELIIDATSSEIVIALLEDKQLVEINKEKSNKKFAVGDIYLGKVKKIMPGLNAAFVDVGYERDAFLHYLDLGHQFRSLSKYLKMATTDKKSVHADDNYLSLKHFVSEGDIDKDGKITDVLATGQNIVVQVAKEPISTKGPRICCEISIAGRHMVLIPFSDKVSISQKIKSTEEKARLKRLISSIKPSNYGIIARTASENKKVAVLDAELRELVLKWESSFKNIKAVKPPSLIIGEISRTSAILRDVLNASFNSVYINDAAAYKEVKEYIENIAPEKNKIVKLYNGNTSIMDNFGINRQIKSLFGKTVTIKSGAYLIIEHTEALHVIDVNSGNRAKKNNNQETNALEVNMLAAEEISRQLRLRDMGGIIVIDFIDMHDYDNKVKVFEKMKQSMALDRTKHNILPLSKFGLMQITRQRVRPEMNIKTDESCPTCKGSGKVASTILIIEQIENNLKYINRFSKTNLTLKVHPFIEAYIKKNIVSLRMKWMFKYQCKIDVIGVTTYPLLEYHFYDTNDEEIMI